MPKVVVRNTSGGEVGDIDLAAEVFEVEANIPLMHQAVVAEEANGRQGTADTKTRSEIQGGGRKPYRQKGTGRARQGSTRAPHMYHGGVVFGPHPRSYGKDMPRKMRRGAVRSALSARLADGDLVVVDELVVSEISTKALVAQFAAMGISGKTLLVVDEVSEALSLSARNIPWLEIRQSPSVSVRDLLLVEKVVMNRAAVEKLQEVLTR